MIKQSRWIIVFMLAFAPLSTNALSFINDFEIPQGETAKLVVPKFDYSSVKGNFNNKDIKFYEITETIDIETAITRAEFLQIIYQNREEATECNCSETKNFPDVSEDSAFYSAIQFATAEGIVHGYEDGLFHPYKKITRGQAAKIIMNTYSPEQTITDVPFFFDVPLDYSLRDYVYNSVRAGVFEGYPDGLMRPQRNITFNEAEIIIKRASHLSKIVNISERPAFRAFLGIHRLSETGAKNLQLELTDSLGDYYTQNVTLTVTKQNFITQWFTLAASKTKLFGKDYQDNTWALVNAAKAEPHETQLWNGPFEKPTTGRVTLGFGDKLYINKVYSGSHFGIDYADKEGTPVWASNSGIVTMASDTPSFGNTVVIDHGQNIFTMYLHLHELKVKAGDAVNKTDLIATMGQTGIATGSHLHFTHFIGDIIVDSQPWYDGKF